MVSSNASSRCQFTVEISAQGPSLCAASVVPGQSQARHSQDLTVTGMRVVFREPLSGASFGIELVTSVNARFDVGVVGSDCGA